MVSKSFLFISILLSLFVFAQCDTIWTQDFNLGNFDEASPLQSIKTDPITIHQSGEATINLSGDIPANSTFEKFVVCISYGVRPSNDATTWAKDGCEGMDTNNRYFELENGEDQNFALRENTLRDIFVTVSVLNITSESNIDNVQLKLTGLNCAVQEVNVGGSCVQYQTLSYGNLYTLTVKAGSWEYFLINVPQNANISTVVFKNYVNAQYFKSNPQQSYMRYGAAPTDEIFDYKGVPSRADSLDIEIVANVAAGGNYIIGVYNNNETDVNSFYTWDYSTCKPGTVGENCNDQVITVNQQSYLGDQVIAPGEWKYYIVEANDTMLFYVRGNGDSDAPSAYGRLVGFPTSKQYDILSVGSKINILDSDEIPTLNSLRDSIIFNTVAKSTFKATRIWYVGVTNPTASNITFGTWVQTDCPNNCEGRGTCEDHVCKCESDDSDPVTCAANKKKGLKVEYIILIVVACCIIVTAAVGTIVYFYRKKTRHTYESF